MTYKFVGAPPKAVFFSGLMLCSMIFIVSVSFGNKYHVTSVSEANEIGSPGDTIYIAAGTYSTTLRPNQSGEPDKYITYLPDSGDVTITGVSKAVNLNGRSYIHIKGLRFTETNGPWIDMSVAKPHHIIIEDCYMYLAYAWSGIAMTGAYNIKILNNTMISHCKCNSMCIGSGDGGPHDLISLYTGHHNLIEGNEFYDAIHTSLSIQDKTDGSTSWNIIRNNFFSNQFHSNLGIWGVEYILVENNIVVDGGENHYNNYCSRSSRDVDMERHKHKGIFVNTQFSIVRNNIAVNNGGGLMVASAISDTQYPWKCNAVENRLYNNTVVKNARGVAHNTTDPAINNIFKNNIFYENFEYNISIYDGSGTPSTNQFINNNIIGSNNRYSTQDVKLDNISMGPEFVNEDNRDYRLLSRSPMIDAGAWLTTATNSGINSKILKVEDARYFMDGWGLIEGDQIQFEGQSSLIMVDSVDYSTNTLWLKENTSWEIGIGINLPYNGTKPDIGSWESSSIPINNYTSDSSCIAAYLMIGESQEWDRSGNNAHLEMDTGEIPCVEGAPTNYDGYSRKFNSGHMLSHDDGSSTDINGEGHSFSWSMWVNFDDEPTDVTYLMGKFQEPLDKQYLVYYDTANKHFSWQLSPDGVNVSTCSGNTSVIAGEWIHLAGFYNAENNQMQLYINAALDLSETNPIKHTDGIYNGNGEFNVGDFSSSGSFDGKIDEVILLNKSISPIEIKGIYQFGINGVNGRLDQQTITSVGLLDQTDDINIYPNPAGNKITICGNPTDQTIGIRIFNMNGVEVYKSLGNYFPAEIEITDFLKGLYIVKVQLENGYSYANKIIKR